MALTDAVELTTDGLRAGARSGGETMADYNYAGWSARQLKEDGGNVDAVPLQKMAELLAFGETQAKEISADLREALWVLTDGWSGRAAATTYTRTSGTARHADTSAGIAAAANTKANDFAKDMADASAEVRAMAAGDPPDAADHLFPAGLIGPSGTASAYVYQAAEAERQRQALVAKITAMDSQAQNAGAGLVNSFSGGRVALPPPPPPSLPPKPGGSGAAGTGSARTTPTAQNWTTTSTPTAPKDPKDQKPGGTSTAPKTGSTPTAPGASDNPTAPGPGGASTVPGSGGASTVPAAAGAGTRPQAVTAPTAAGVVTSPAPGTQPGGTALPGGASAAGGAGGVGGSLLGGALAAGGASTAPGASGVGLPGTVSGGRAPGTAGTTGGGLPARPSSGPRPATPLGGGRPGTTAPLGPMTPGSGPTGQTPRRTVGRTGVLRSTVGEPSAGPRPGVLPGGPVGGGGAGRGAPGRPGRALPMGGAGRRRDEDAELSGRPDYLVESDSVWGDGRKVVRGVLGRRPRSNEERDTR